MDFDKIVEERLIGMHNILKAKTIVEGLDIPEEEFEDILESMDIELLEEELMESCDEILDIANKKTTKEK